MLDFSQLKPAFMKKLKNIDLKNVIIQKGPKLISLDCLETNQDLNISIKKINLGKRPSSANNSSYRIRRNSSIKRNEQNINSPSKNSIHYKRQAYFFNTNNLKKKLYIRTKPFPERKTPIINF